MLRSTAARALTVVTTVVALAGCSGGPSQPASRTPAAASRGADGQAEEQLRQELLAQVAQDRGITDPPDVAVVRWVTTEEHSSAMAECLTEEGFPATMTDDGGMEVEYTVDQEPALDLAVYLCTGRYPVRQAQAGVPPESYVRELYDFYVDEVVPCLEAQGEAVRDVPTWETFRDTFPRGTGWYPYEELVETQRLTPELQAACPATLP